MSISIVKESVYKTNSQKDSIGKIILVKYVALSMINGFLYSLAKVGQQDNYLKKIAYVVLTTLVAPVGTPIKVGLIACRRFHGIYMDPIVDRNGFYA